VTDPAELDAYVRQYNERLDEETGEEEDVFDPYERQEPIVRETPKIGRNDPCPCGSGKKYKKCCGK
jgi:preprotein translocase subunit SecA